MTPPDIRILDMVAAQKDRAQKSKGFQFKLFDEMLGNPVAKDWLVKGIFARREQSAWIAPPGGLKSALLTGAAICIAAGLPWFGRRNKAGAVGVVYFALERADLVERRIKALRVRMGLEHLPIAVVRATFDLRHPESVKRVIETIREVERELGVPVGFVIFDTFAKLISAADGDEDKAKDQGVIFANMDRIAEQVNAHLAIIGHTGKDETRGARGSNAILGHVDLLVTISGAETKTATADKCNDGPEGPLFSFRSEVHSFGVDEDGDEITVNVVSSEEVSPQSAGKARGRWPKGLKLVHEAIQGALLEKGRDHRVGRDGPTVPAVSVLEARSVHSQRFVSSGDGDADAAERQAWKRNFAKARQQDLIGAETANGKELVWLIST